MFGKKKAPSVSAQFCRVMESLRTAIEVYSGKRTRFIQIDFTTGKGKVCVGEDEKELRFLPTHRSDLIELDIGDGWLTALIDDLGQEVKVINVHNPVVRKTTAGDCTMRWVGKSATERHEEPLQRNWWHIAKELGLTNLVPDSTQR